MLKNQFKKIDKESVYKLRKYDKLIKVFNSKSEPQAFFALISVFMSLIIFDPKHLLLQTISVICLISSITIFYYFLYKTNRANKDKFYKEKLEYTTHSLYIKSINGKNIDFNNILKNINNRFYYILYDKNFSENDIILEHKNKSYFQRILFKNNDIDLYKNYKFTRTEKTISCMEYLLLSEKIEKTKKEILLKKSNIDKYNNNQEAKKQKEQNIEPIITELEKDISLCKERMEKLKNFIQKLEIQELNIEHNIELKYIRKKKSDIENQDYFNEIDNKLHLLDEISDKNKAFISTDRLFN